MTVAQATQNLCVRFGRPDTQMSVVPAGLVLDLSVPFLAGLAEEHHPVENPVELTSDGELHQMRSPDSITGALVLPAVTDTLEAAASQIYRRILAELRGFHLYRVWNFVPQINLVTDGLENYHRFNIGRWRAFSEHFGAELHSKMPAASAVGIDDPVLVTIFAAGRQPVRYVENPQQLPAWRYPEQYGPKSPSFSRGARSDSELSGLRAFISGTASIKGHETVGKGDLDTQVRVTCENLRIVAQSLDLPSPFSADSPAYSAKVYLRRAEDTSTVQALLAKYGEPTFLNRASFLQADICRADLDVEIEVTYF